MNLFNELIQLRIVDFAVAALHINVIEPIRLIHGYMQKIRFRDYIPKLICFVVIVWR